MSKGYLGIFSKQNLFQFTLEYTPQTADKKQVKKDSLKTVFPNNSTWLITTYTFNQTPKGFFFYFCNAGD